MREIERGVGRSSLTGVRPCPGENLWAASRLYNEQPGAAGMRILIAGLIICVAGCSSSYDNRPLDYSKRGPIEREPAPDHSSLNADNQRQMGLQLQNAEYKARTAPMLGPSR